MFRYQLEVTDRQGITLPAAHTLLSVAPGRSDYHVDLWAKVTPSSSEDLTRVFRIFGTGHQMPETPLEFIGTAVMPDGLVWYVFAEPIPIT